MRWLQICSLEEQSQSDWPLYHIVMTHYRQIAYMSAPAGGVKSLGIALYFGEVPNVDDSRRKVGRDFKVPRRQSSVLRPATQAGLFLWWCQELPKNCRHRIRAKRRILVPSDLMHVATWTLFELMLVGLSMPCINLYWLERVGMRV